MFNKFSPTENRAVYEIMWKNIRNKGLRIFRGTKLGDYQENLLSRTCRTVISPCPMQVYKHLMTEEKSIQKMIKSDIKLTSINIPDNTCVN
jgi:hypothetical protein